MTPLLSASSRLCQGIYTAQADRWSTSALEERGRGLSHATPSLNHCHPERSAKERSDGARVEGPRFPQHHHDYVREFTPHELIDGPPRHRKREAAASAKPRPSSSHCHPERSEKERSDGARVEGPAFLRANTTTSGNPHRCTRTSSTLTTNPCQCRACLGVDFLYTY